MVTQWTSASSSSDQLSESISDYIEFCNCSPRREANHGVSWSSFPGRRFRGCELYKREVPSSGCGYFRWVDDPLPGHVVRIIKGLMNRKIFAEQRVEQLDLKVKDMAADIESLLEMKSKLIGQKGKKLTPVEKNRVVAENQRLQEKLARMELVFWTVLCMLVIVIGMGLVLGAMYK